MVPSLRGLGSVVTAVLAVLLAVASCGTAPSPPGSVAGAQTGQSPSAAVESPSLPPATPAAVESADPSTPSAAPATPTPTGPAASSPALACSGTAENRDFFATVAGLVTWDVYCGTVPDGWYVESGQWRLRDGGRLDVTYHGPNGARIVLAEGVFCTDTASACAPHDRVLGTASFGDRQGQLVSVGGAFAIYVDPGQRPAWQATATGLDQQTFVSLAAALYRVGS